MHDREASARCVSIAALTHPSAIQQVEESSGHRSTSLQCLTEILALVLEDTFQAVTSSYTRGTLFVHGVLGSAKYDHDLEHRLEFSSKCPMTASPKTRQGTTQPDRYPLLGVLYSSSLIPTVVLLHLLAGT